MRYIDDKGRLLLLLPELLRHHRRVQLKASVRAWPTNLRPTARPSGFPISSLKPPLLLPHTSVWLSRMLDFASNSENTESFKTSLSCFYFAQNKKALTKASSCIFSSVS